MLTVRPYGTTVATPGRPASDVELVEIASDSVTVRLLTLGAAIHSVDTPDRDGRPGPVHLTLADLAAYADPGRNPHLGSSIGRFANRIAGARFPLEGGEVHLVANNGPNTLHGGPWGWDRQVWDLLDADGSDHGGTALFRLVSPDGDEGFPGTATATACFELEGEVLRITYGATTDAPTVVNMTNHGYWNLDGAPTVADHHLVLAADRVLPVDGAGIPSGGLEPVDGTPFDLRARTQLGPAIERGGARLRPVLRGPWPGRDGPGRRGAGRPGVGPVDVGAHRPGGGAAVHRQRTGRPVPGPRVGVAGDAGLPGHPQPPGAGLHPVGPRPAVRERHRAAVRHR